MAISEVYSTEEFSKVLDNAGNKLVVIDYSATWCGPCKMMMPKYEALSTIYNADAIFLKCVGDLSAEAQQLMKKEGVRSLPSFHFWKNGEKIDVVTGARIDDVEQAIRSGIK